MSEDKLKDDQPKSWWQTIPGILTGIAGIVTAIASLVAVLHQVGYLGTGDVNTDNNSDTSSENAPLEQKDDSEVQAKINDPDGYTNIRSGPGIDYETVARVVDNEIFYTIPQQSDWWPVRTKDDKLGYMHRSRISLQN